VLDSAAKNICCIIFLADDVGDMLEFFSLLGLVGDAIVRVGRCDFGEIFLGVGLRL
jgi:hypothetical protein